MLSISDSTNSNVNNKHNNNSKSNLKRTLCVSVIGDRKHVVFSLELHSFSFILEKPQNPSPLLILFPSSGMPLSTYTPFQNSRHKLLTQA